MKQPRMGIHVKKTAYFCLFLLLSLAVLSSSLASSIADVSVSAAPLSRSVPAKEGMVRVYLSSLGNPTYLNLTLQGEYQLGATGVKLPSGTTAKVGFQQGTGALSFTYNGQTLQMGSSFSLSRSSASGKSGILIQESRESSNPYPGDLLFEAVWTNGGFKLYTIAHVFIEDYLYGVLPYEMGNAWPLEALKAQAVAARTYTVRMMNNRASGRYDVQDTTSDQVYRGTPSGNANCKTAVDETKGMVLMYGSDYITTYYSSSNGGQTEISRTGSVPGYMKVKDDPFDYASTGATVRKSTIAANLQSGSSALISLLKQKAVSRLSQQGYAATSENTTLKTLKSVFAHTPRYASPSRLYTKMDFTMEVQTRTYSGLITTLTVTVTCDIFDELESLLSMSLQSSDNELWSVVEQGSSFQLQARRYGHGMGMSQYGAMQMARTGYTYDQILGFYYEGCSRVQHSFTSSILNGTGDQNVVVQPPAELEIVVPGGCHGTISMAVANGLQSVYSAKSSAASVSGVAPAGALVEVITADDGWCFVRYGELYGYMPASSIEYSGTPSGTDTGATVVAGMARVTAGDYINLRASGSLSARVLGTAPSGAEVTVFSISEPWAKVQYNALAAYAHTDYLSITRTEIPEEAPASGTPVYVWSQDGGSVNLREMPSTDSQVLKLIPFGTLVEKLSETAGWSKIRYEEQEGYILSSFLMEQDPTLQPAPPQEEEEEAGVTAVVNTTYGTLNLRAAANAYSLVLTAIPKGETVAVLSHGEEWSQVSWNGYAGYVMNRYLIFAGETPPASEPENRKTAAVSTPGGVLNMRSLPWIGGAVVRQLQPGQNVSVLEYGAEWCRISVDGLEGYVMTTFLDFSPATDVPPDKGEEETAAQTAVVSTPGGGLNLRAAPSAYAEVLTLIPQGAAVEVLVPGDTWSEIRFQSWNGFVMTSMLRFGQPTPSVPQEAQTAWVDTPSGSLNLRSDPNSYAALVTVIPRLAEVQVTSIGQEWCAVCYGEYAGYVMTRYLSFEPLDSEGNDAGMPSETDAVDVWVNTESGTLNMRQEPDAYAALVTTIPRGARAKMLIEGNEWSYLLYNGHYGYVMTRYLQTNPPDVSSESGDILHEPETEQFATNISNEQTPLWPSRREEGIPIGYIPAGETVRVLLNGSTWSCVEYGSLQGFCKTEALSVME